MSHQLLNKIDLSEGISEEVISLPHAKGVLKGNFINGDNFHKAAVVFLHGWGGMRSGPHRILTKFARAFAGLNFPSVRFDFSGRGESTYSDENINLATMADDLVMVEKYLNEQNIDSIILFGMCSGGNLAIGSLPRLQNVKAMILLSVYPFSDGDSFGRNLNQTKSLLKSYIHKATSLSNWKRLFTGDASLGRIFKVLLSPFRQNNADKEGDIAADDKDKHLNNLTKDLPCCMIYGSSDPDYEVSEKYFKSYTKPRHLPVDFHLIENANHNYSSPKWENEVKEICVKFLESLDE